MAHAALLILAPMPLAARPRVPEGELTLDAMAPVIAVTIAGVGLHLRVDPGEHRFLLLDRAAAAALPLAWTGESETDVGRIRLHGRVAAARMHVAGRTLPVIVATYDRDCCSGVDGAIGPDILPYAIIRWQRAAAPEPTGERTLALQQDDRTGFYAEAGREAPGLRLSFTFYRTRTVATAAGAAILARAWGGRWDGMPAMGPAPFGLTRPIRPMAFARPGTLAGFPFDRMIVRTADFGGRAQLPADATGADDIVVSRPLPPQDAWPAVVLGEDRLRACAEILYRVRPRTLTLRCAFEEGVAR